MSAASFFFYFFLVLKSGGSQQVEFLFSSSLKHCFECDFLFVALINQRLCVLVAAPEILNYEPITTATDMW